MSAIITVLHILICIILIVAVLLQSGKSADLAGAFGGGGSQTAFGPRGTATLMSKITTIGAILFMITSFTLWLWSDKGAKSVMKGGPLEKQQAVPAAAEPKKEATKPPAAESPKTEDKKAAQPQTTQQAPQKKAADTAGQKKK